MIYRVKDAECDSSYITIMSQGKDRYHEQLEKQITRKRDQC